MKTSEATFPFNNSKRLLMVDAIRGFALAGIVFLHNLEHYHLFAPAEKNPVWLANVDLVMWKGFYFIFKGNAYEIFALLFGFSFWVQYQYHRPQSEKFIPLYVGRMVVLFGFGLVHGLFFGGDILTIYAVTSCILLITRKWPDRSILILAGLLLLQPVDLIRVIFSFFHPEFVYLGHFEEFLDRLYQNQIQGSFFNMLWLNATYGHLGNLAWNWENGRFFNAPALFLLGMYVARNKHFEIIRPKIWIYTFAISLCIAIPFHLIAIFSYSYIVREPLGKLFANLIGVYGNFPKTMLLISSLVLLWHYSPRIRSIQTILSPFGRMSLTNYITQSLIGTTLYMGYGFGLYRYCGGTLSVCIGLITLLIQITWSRWWLDRYVQGPLEYIWKKTSTAMIVPCSHPKVNVDRRI